MAKAILHANEHPSANGTDANGDAKPTYTHHRPRSPTRFSRPSAAAAASPFLTDKGQRSHLLGSFGPSSSECLPPSAPRPSVPVLALCDRSQLDISCLDPKSDLKSDGGADRMSDRNADPKSGLK